MITMTRAFFLLAFAVSTAAAQSTLPIAEDESPLLLSRVKHFYSWVLLNEKSVTRLEPHIRTEKGSAKFYLDVSTLQAFSGAFMKSGDFSTDFPSKIEKYYGDHKKRFNRYTKKEFVQMKKSGRGPLMETEDMDIFFCAQEYEYAQSFVDGLTLIDLKSNGQTASALVVSPYNWKTEFQFKKVGQRWLISVYCVFK